MASNFKSAFEAIPGRDALLEYQEKSYPISTYVERNGLIFKSITATSENFILSQWELVNDLREVRVPNIAARNSLTGTTGTSYGVHTPILDNTNVLVLDASADPDVGIAQFARYNYNQGNASWLLLQVGTGSTSASTSIEYSNVLNRPFVVSGVTVNAGAGLSGGGSVFGSIPAAGGVISLAHANTSSQTNLTPTGRTYIQQLRFDTYGHVTGATQSVWTHPDTSTQANELNTGRTYIQSISVDGNGHITNIASSPWTHPDTSTQANSVNAGNAFIQTIYLDGDGHVIGIGTGVTASGGSSVLPLRYNGNSGGALTMNSGATLTLSGGTNILTVRTGNAANPGLQINVNPAGINGQIQFNNGISGLGASANLFFSAGTSTLRSLNYVIGGVPASGSTSNPILVRNSITGAIQSITLGSIESSFAGLPINANQYRDASGFAGNSNWTFNPTNNSLALGIRLSGSTIGNNSMVITDNSSSAASGTSAFAHGQDAYAGGASSYAGGNQTKATGVAAHAEGINTIARGGYSHAEGGATLASGDGSHAQGYQTIASGLVSHAGGYGFGLTKEIISAAKASFNHSENTSSQVAGHGALAANSAILGGLNHNIESTNLRAAIIGGNGIKLTGNTYIDHTAIANLAIFSTPTFSNNNEDVLIWNSTNKKIGRITQALLKTTPAGSNGSIQFRDASGNFNSSVNLFYLTGSSTLTTSNLNIGTVPVSGTNTQILTRNVSTGMVERIGMNSIASLPLNANQYRTSNGFGGHNEWIFDPTNRALTLGVRTGTTGQNSFVVGLNNSTSALYSMAIGNVLRVSGAQSIAYGTNNRVSGTNSLVGGLNSIASGSFSFASGMNVSATTNGSHAYGQLTIASGAQSHASGLGVSITTPIVASGVASFNHSQNEFTQIAGHGALAPNSVILGGVNHNIESGNFRAAIIGGTGIKLTGSTYANYTAVSNLAIFSTPANAVTGDTHLTWNSNSKKITKIPLVSFNMTAYVSLNGNDSTGVVGFVNRPFLNIQTAVNALNALSPSSTNRGTVYVMQSSVHAQTTLRNFVDICLNGAEIVGIDDSAGSVNSKVYGMGIIRQISVTNASTICVDVSEIIAPAGQNAVLISTTSTIPEVHISANNISGHIQCNNGLVFIRANKFINGFINPFGTNSVSLKLFCDFEYMRGQTTVPIQFNSSSIANVDIVINSKRLEHFNTSSSGIDISNSFIGKLYINIDEVISSGSTAAIRVLQNSATSDITIKGKFINKNAGNIPALVVGNSGGAKLKILGGSMFVPSGSGASINGNATYAIIGEAFGKNANSGVQTIGVGVFTVDSTYIV